MSNHFLKIYKQRERKQLEIILTNIMESVCKLNKITILTDLIWNDYDKIENFNEHKRKKLIEKIENEHKNYKILVFEIVDLQEKLIKFLIFENYKSQSIGDNISSNDASNNDSNMGEIVYKIVEDSTDLLKLVGKVIKIYFEKLKCQYKAIEIIKEKKGTRKRLLSDIWDGRNKHNAQFNFNVNETFEYFINLYC